MLRLAWLLSVAAAQDVWDPQARSAVRPPPKSVLPAALTPTLATDSAGLVIKLKGAANERQPPGNIRATPSSASAALWVGPAKTQRQSTRLTAWESEDASARPAVLRPLNGKQPSDRSFTWAAADSPAVAVLQDQIIPQTRQFLQDQQEQKPVSRDAAELCPFGDAGGCWPSVYILGTQKAATTALFYAYHNQGKLLCGSRFRKNESMFEPFNEKEAQLFNLDLPSDLLMKPWKFTKNFRRDDCPNGRFVDATPNYLFNWFSPPRMLSLFPAAVLPKIRMLAILREPIARDLSWYNHRLLDPGLPDAGNLSFCAQVSDGYGPTYAEETLCGYEKLKHCLATPGAKASGLMGAYANCKEGDRNVEGLTVGMYAAHIQRWTKFFSRKHIMIFQYEQFVKHTQTHLRATSRFFGVPELRTDSLPLLNTHEGSKKIHTIECETSRVLKEVFQPWNAMLYEAMQSDAWSNSNPDDEIPFKPFAEEVPCTTERQEPPLLAVYRGNSENFKEELEKQTPKAVTKSVRARVDLMTQHASASPEPSSSQQVTHSVQPPQPPQTEQPPQREGQPTVPTMPTVPTQTVPSDTLPPTSLSLLQEDATLVNRSIGQANRFNQGPFGPGGRHPIADMLAPPFLGMQTPTGFPQTMQAPSRQEALPVWSRAPSEQTGERR